MPFYRVVLDESFSCIQEAESERDAKEKFLKGLKAEIEAADADSFLMFVDEVQMPLMP